MKYKLKAGLGTYSVNVNGRYYRLNETDFREYPQEILSMYEGKLIPEHETKTKKHTVIEMPITEEEQT